MTRVSDRFGDETGEAAADRSGAGQALGEVLVAPFAARIAELEAVLRTIADGEVDDGGNRRNYQHATADARRVLGMSR